MDHHEQTTQEAFIWAIIFWIRFIDNIFTTFLGTINQPQSLEDFMNHLQPTIKFTFQHYTQKISFLEIKIHIRADHKLFTTLYKKPTDYAVLLHFHSHHSLKWKESIVFSQALRYNLLTADDNLLQKELHSPTISLITGQYSLEIISRNFFIVLLHSRDTLLYEPNKTSGTKTVLTIVTPYSIEGRCFSQSV